MVELWPLTLERALEAFPVPVRTRDALHLATAEYLFRQRRQIELATYDGRMADAAEAMGVPLFDLQAAPGTHGG